MSDDLKHECAVAMVVLKKPPCATGDYGGVKLSLLLEKQHNRGQDGAGAAIVAANPEAGVAPYRVFKSASATPLADVLGMLTKRDNSHEERIFLGHLRYATFGKNEESFCHPFVHASSELEKTVILAGNFNLTNAAELFDGFRRQHCFPTSRADGYLIAELVAHELDRGDRPSRPRSRGTHASASKIPSIASALSRALKDADGAWTLIGAMADGTAFATRDPHGIRPGWYYADDDVVVVASERAAIQAAFDLAPETVRELPPGEALIVSPQGEIGFVELGVRQETRDEAVCNRQCKRSNNPDSQTIRHTPCAFERIYFSRANDADIHRERKALGAALVPSILKAAHAPMERIFFSYIPNSARIAFHGLLEELIKMGLTQSLGALAPKAADCLDEANQNGRTGPRDAERNSPRLCANDISLPRFGEVIVKDAKFRTFIADAAARREFYKHVYDVTYGLVGENDTLVVLDDSIVRGNTMKNAILPMLARLGPRRIVVASSAPPIRYPDCYGIDMSTLDELIAFRALVNLLDGERGAGNGERVLREALAGRCVATPPHAEGTTLLASHNSDVNPVENNPLASLYDRFTEEQHCAEIARLLTPPGMKAEVVVVYQTIENLHKALSPLPGPTFRVPRFGDWYFTGDYPTPGGYKVLHKALANYLARKTDRSY